MAGFDFHTYCARCRDKGKGDNPCVKKEAVCRYCDVLTQDQKARLSTPSYQEKEKKSELKAIQEESNSTLVDPALVTVIGVAKDREGLNQKEASSTPSGVKAKKCCSGSEELSCSCERQRKAVMKSLAKTTRATTDNKLKLLDQKWSERFSRFEAMLLSKSFNKPEPTF